MPMQSFLWVSSCQRQLHKYCQKLAENCLELWLQLTSRPNYSNEVSSSLFLVHYIWHLCARWWMNNNCACMRFVYVRSQTQSFICYLVVPVRVSCFRVCIWVWLNAHREAEIKWEENVKRNRQIAPASLTKTKLHTFGQILYTIHK